MTAVTLPEESGHADDEEPPGGQAGVPRLPPPDHLLLTTEDAERLEGLGAAGRRLVLREAKLRFDREAEEHRQWCLDQVHRRRMDLISLGFRAAGTVTGAAGLAGYLWIAKYFVDHDAAVPAAGMLGGGVAALTAAFFRAQNRKE
ncbi:hypothetical protein [Kitasatospora sp. NPDC097691]|uniref:hypothetical protein n=1 Tax=Kitasatospora sp. NPDC097691 TaxID=3157231 RepID=UPI0033198316